MAFKVSKPPMCEECGSGPVHHRTTYIIVAVDGLLNPIFTPGFFTRFLFSRVHLLGRAVSPYIFHTLVRAGWAKKHTEIDDDTQLLAQMLWKEAAKRRITVWEFRFMGLARNIFIAEFSDGRKISYEGTPLPSHGIHQAWWIDDKAVLKKKFLKVGIPVPRGGSVFKNNGALNLFRNLEAPVIVKPRTGSGSRHTILHIKDEQELLRAFDIATQVSPSAIIEEELEGAVYRATVVDGKLSATLRRDQPYVIGDGKSTIKELVDDANKHPARSGPFFSKITIDDSAMKELVWHGYSLQDILPKGNRVNFHQKINWSVGGTTADVTDDVHPDNVELFEHVAEVLKAPIVGIDFIIGDISRSWKEQRRCGIIECNSMPFFDNHHLPFEGKPRNVAGDIWDMMEKHK